MLLIQNLAFALGTDINRKYGLQANFLIDPGFHTEVESNLDVPQDNPGEDGIGTDLPLGDELAVDL